MYCKKCGNEVNDSAAFCKKCGYRFQTGDKPAGVQARASVRASVSPSPVRVTPAAAEPVSAGVKPRARVNKYFVIGLAAILVVVAAVVVIINFVVKATKSDEDIIIEAFKNTFVAESYKYTLKCNPINGEEDYDKNSQYISYVERSSNNGDVVFYVEDCSKRKGSKDYYERYVYKKGKWYEREDDDYVEIEYDDKDDKKDAEKKTKSIIKNYYAINYIDSGYTSLDMVMSTNSTEALEPLLKKYFEKGKLDCVKEYTKKGDKYSFKIDYANLAKTLDVDYGKAIKHNIVKTTANQEGADKVKYTLNVDFTVEKDHLKNLNLLLVAEYDKSNYAKLGKWNYEFKNVDKLKYDNCKVSNIKTITQDERRANLLQKANENARVAYEFLITSNPYDVFIKEYDGYIFSLDEYAEDKEYYDDAKYDYDEGTYNYYYYNTIGKLYNVMSEKENDENIGKVAFNIKEIDGKEQYFVQWKNNDDIIGQYPNPTDPEDKVEWDVYNPN